MPSSPWILNRNGAWCWYQDERAVLDPERNLLLIGSVAAPEGEDGAARAGNVELTVADLEGREVRTVVLHERLQSDDHNVPALWRRRDGRWLAMYTAHNSDSLTRWRVSEPDDPTTWGAESTFDWRSVTDDVRVTYSNVHALDGRLYCFARAANDDACALVSDDEGSTWSYAGKLFDRPKVGYVNGYCRYASAGALATDGNRLDVITTDHHPRDHDNSIYHGYLAGGALHRTDGTVLDPYPLGAGVDQGGLTTVLRAGSVWDGATISRAWTTDLRRDPSGRLAAIMTARADDHPDRPDDRRFFYGRLGEDGTWVVQHLAKAGARLFQREEDYTGLVAIDPYDVDAVVMSTPIDPRDGRILTHHEIFAGRTGDDGVTWSWTPLTQDSEVDNLRPIHVPGDPDRSVVLWFRGTMRTSQHYDCEIAALVQRRPVPR